MAPEVLRNHGRAGKGYTEKADVWSVGCTVIEMATGERPWPQFHEAETVMFHVAMQSHARPEKPAWVSEACGDFLDKCFARDPEQRPTVKELLTHPMVANARLQEAQRLGSNAADPEQISLDLHENPNDAEKIEPSVRMATMLLYEKEDGDDSDSSEEGLSPRVAAVPARAHSSGKPTGHAGAEVEVEDGNSLSILPASHRREDVQGNNFRGDALMALQLIEAAHKFVQTELTSNREKCFRLAQRMRRAKIPLEKILAQADGDDDELRHKIMDLRDELENSVECLRKHGTMRVARLWQVFMRRMILSDFEEREMALCNLIAGLDQGIMMDRTQRPEPDLWSRRLASAFNPWRFDSEILVPLCVVFIAGLYQGIQAIGHWYHFLSCFDSGAASGHVGNGTTETKPYLGLKTIVPLIHVPVSLHCWSCCSLSS